MQTTLGFDCAGATLAARRSAQPDYRFVPLKGNDFRQLLAKVSGQSSSAKRRPATADPPARTAIGMLIKQFRGPGCCLSLSASNEP